MSFHLCLNSTPNKLHAPSIGSGELKIVQGGSKFSRINRDYSRLH